MVLGMSLTQCSYYTAFYIANTSDVARSVSIYLDPKPAGIPIFEAQRFVLFDIKDGKVDFERHQTFFPNENLAHEIVIPAHTALQIARLFNEKYLHSQQQFINGRVFNLLKIVTPTTMITQKNFDDHFKKSGYGFVWKLP
jgi:hypothetical protein